MALYLGGQRKKIALNGILYLPLYASTNAAIALLTKDGHILFDYNGNSLKVGSSEIATDDFNILTTIDGFVLTDSQGSLLSIDKTADPIVSNNILMSSDNYALLDFDNKKIIIQGV